MAKYLIRFDDINSRMDWNKFFIIKNSLEKYNIKSILGIVPNCKDKSLFFSKEIENYYEYLKKYQIYGDTIAQHGFEHKYDSSAKGFFGNFNNSEFAGHSYEIQLKKLLEGKKILKKELIWEPVFMAPAHSFDLNTLKALYKLGFYKILDGFSLFPYKYKNLIFIPQISSRPLPIFLPCISQLCIHINTIKEDDLEKLISFIDRNHKNFISINQIEIENISERIFEKFFITLLIKTFRSFKALIKIFLILYIKYLCIMQRIYYRLKLFNTKINNWHLQGTFFCRKYKILSLEIIKDLKPTLYVDIGCGFGEILSKLELDKEYKLGYDIDPNLNLVIKKLNKKEKFKYFSLESSLINYAKRLTFKRKKKIIISMLNFSHNISLKEIQEKIDFYYRELGTYILLIDNINIKEKSYKFNHHEYFFNHKGLIKFFYKVDQLRSIYCIKIG